MEIITPKDSVGTLMELCQARRGDFIDMQFLTETRTTLIYELPLALVSPFSHPCPPEPLDPMHMLHRTGLPIVVLDQTTPAGMSVFWRSVHLQNLQMHETAKARPAFCSSPHLLAYGTTCVVHKLCTCHGQGSSPESFCCNSKHISRGAVGGDRLLR